MVPRVSFYYIFILFYWAYIFYPLCRSNILMHAGCERTNCWAQLGTKWKGRMKEKTKRGSICFSSTSSGKTWLLLLHWPILNMSISVCLEHLNCQKHLNKVFKCQFCKYYDAHFHSCGILDQEFELQQQKNIQLIINFIDWTSTVEAVVCHSLKEPKSNLRTSFTAQLTVSKWKMSWKSLPVAIIQAGNKIISRMDFWRGATLRDMLS